MVQETLLQITKLISSAKLPQDLKVIFQIDADSTFLVNLTWNPDRTNYICEFVQQYLDSPVISEIESDTGDSFSCIHISGSKILLTSLFHREGVSGIFRETGEVDELVLSGSSGKHRVLLLYTSEWDNRTITISLVRNHNKK